MNDMDDRTKALWNRVPFTKLLGFEFISCEKGYVELKMPMKEELLQQHGFAHGGAVATLADSAMGNAAGTVVGNIVTAEFKINYLRPAVGEHLLARASVEHAGKRIVVVQCKVFAIKDGEEKLCALAQGTMAASNAEVA